MSNTEKKGKKTPRFTAADKEKLVDWLATPSKYRKPGTVAGYANANDWDAATIHRWKKRLITKANELAKSMLISHLPNVLDAIIDEAENGSINHIKLYLQMIGEMPDEKGGHAEKQKITIEYVDTTT